MLSDVVNNFYVKDGKIYERTPEGDVERTDMPVMQKPEESE